MTDVQKHFVKTHRLERCPPMRVPSEHLHIIPKKELAYLIMGEGLEDEMV